MVLTETDKHLGNGEDTCKDKPSIQLPSKDLHWKWDKTNWRKDRINRSMLLDNGRAIYQCLQLKGCTYVLFTWFWAKLNYLKYFLTSLSPLNKKKFKFLILDILHHPAHYLKRKKLYVSLLNNLFVFFN